MAAAAAAAPIQERATEVKIYELWGFDPPSGKLSPREWFRKQPAVLENTPDGDAIARIIDPAGVRGGRSDGTARQREGHA